MRVATMLWADARSAEAALLPEHERVNCERTERVMTIGELARDPMRRHAPAVLVLTTGHAIAIPRQGRVLGPDGQDCRVPWTQLRELWEQDERRKEYEAFAGLAATASAVRKLVDRRVATRPAVRVISLSAHPSTPFVRQLQGIGWWTRLAAAFAAHLGSYLAMVAGWALLGRAAFTGHWDAGWFFGWLALLALAIPLQLAAQWWQGWVAVAFGGLLRQRLLSGSLVIDTAVIRQLGVGQLLSRVLEAETLENLSLTGGTAALLATAELIVGAAVLAMAASPALLLAVLLLWLVVLGAVLAVLAGRRAAWLESRVQMTHLLVEYMAGNRTRIAQQPSGQWHRTEDELLSAYSTRSLRMDAVHSWLIAFGARGWLTLALAALAWLLLDGSASPAEIAIAAGGVLLIAQALQRLIGGALQCAGAWQSWLAVRQLFRAAAAEAPRSPAPLAVSEGHDLEVRDLSFRHSPDGRTVLDACSFTIRAGDRLLLEGPSGSGKSTLGSLLSGLRQPTSGLVLAGHLDIATTGAQAWRRRVATAPQYHENHMLSASLLFNLLLSRAWPPSPADLADARAVCRELGLDPLIRRMPAGLWETVGDSGWQLSHGERSRVFLARAILQGADLVVLDESFAALDPETLDQCLTCVVKRAPSLLVIAHP